ncbi:MAG: FdtA/QdtA family cupin domain-containing protein [Bacteroidota bacterium]
MNKILHLSSFIDEATLISTQDESSIPFTIKRVFILRDVKDGTVRGKHAHIQTKQALFCIQGSVTVQLDNGKRKKTYRLTKPNKGIFIDQMVWSEMNDFSSDAILIVFASESYRSQDYIRDYRSFLQKAQ